MTTTIVSAAEIIAAAQEKSTSVIADNDPWTVDGWLNTTVVPFSGPLTNIDVWLVWAVYKLDRLKLLGNLFKFCEKFGAYDEHFELISNIDELMIKYNNEWPELFRDYIIPFDRIRQAVARTLAFQFFDLDRQFNIVIQDVDKKLTSFFSEYRWLYNNQITKFWIAFDEWFCIEYCPYYEQLTGSETWKIKTFLSESPAYHPLYDIMLSKLRESKDAADYLDAYAVWYACPSVVKQVSEDPFENKPKPTGSIHVRKIIYDTNFRKIKVIGQPNPKKAEAKKGKLADHPKIFEHVPTPDLTIPKPDPENCVHSFIQGPGVVDTRFMICEHCDDIRPIFEEEGD